MGRDSNFVAKVDAIKKNSVILNVTSKTTLKNRLKTQVSIYRELTIISSDRFKSRQSGVASASARP